MAVCDSLGNYILFQTGSRNPTRTWARADSSGTDTTGPRVNEKLKFTVLKNPPSTVQAPVRSRLTTSFTVAIGSRLYAIDPAIYDALLASLVTRPVSSLAQLQERIKEIRVLTGTPPPLAVQLVDIPLSQYKKRYTYKTTESPAGQVEERTKYDFGYKTGSLVNLALAPLINVILTINRVKYPSLYFAPPQFVSVVGNGGCFITNTQIRDLYPNGKADIFGTPLLSKQNLDAFQNNSLIQFASVFAYFLPASNRAYGGKFRARAGLMLGFDTRLSFSSSTAFAKLLADNSELIFIPIMSTIEQLSHINFPMGMGLDLRLVDGRSNGDLELFGEFVNQINVGMTNNKGLSFTPA